MRNRTICLVASCLRAFYRGVPDRVDARIVQVGLFSRNGNEMEGLVAWLLPGQQYSTSRGCESREQTSGRLQACHLRSPAFNVSLCELVSLVLACPFVLQSFEWYVFVIINLQILGAIHRWDGATTGTLTLEWEGATTRAH